MEWVFGITDQEPQGWKRCEPRWDDEQLTASSSHSFLELMDKLCETALAKRRCDHDYGIKDHLWHFEICTEKSLTNQRQMEIRRMEDTLDNLHGGGDDDDNSEVNSSDEEDDHDPDEDQYRGTFMVMPREHIEHHRDTSVGDDYQYEAAETTKLSRQLLPQGMMIKCTYDFGTTTTLYSKVMSVRHKAVNALLQYFEAEEDAAAQTADLKKVPPTTCPRTSNWIRFIQTFPRSLWGTMFPSMHAKTTGVMM